MSAWVNESCRFHLINTSPFLAIHIRHAGPGTGTLPGGAEGRWELGRDAGAVNTGQSVGSQVWEGPGWGVPWGVKQRDSSPCTFPPGPTARQTGRRGHPDRLPLLLQLRLSPSKGRWEVTSPGGLGPTRGGIPGHHSQVQVPKPSDQNEMGSEGRGPKGAFSIPGPLSSNSAGSLTFPSTAPTGGTGTAPDRRFLAGAGGLRPALTQPAIPGRVTSPPVLPSGTSLLLPRGSPGHQ